MRRILFLLLLLALMICLCSCRMSLMISDANLSDGIVAVQVDTHSTPIHEQEEGTHYYTILSAAGIVRNGYAAHCEPFEPDEAEVFSVKLPDYDIYKGKPQPRVGEIIIQDADGMNADSDPILYEIAELFRDFPHSIFRMKIYRIGEEYILCFAENVNLHTPNRIYYYNTEQKTIHLLYVFEDEYIEAVKIVSPEKLHELR